MNCETIWCWIQDNLFDALAVIISIAALIFSIKQFTCERKRNRKEATIHAFDALEGIESVIYLMRLTKREINDLVKSRKKHDKRIENDWKNLSRALPLIEHFAVGVNSKVYDIETLNSMAGNKIITTYYACDNLIKYKREGNGNENNYSEFEKMVKSLINIRKNNNQSVPKKNK